MAYVLALIMVLSTNVFKLQTVNDIAPIDEIKLACCGILLLISTLRYKRKICSSRIINKFVLLYAIAVVASFVVALSDRDQGLLQSFISTRSLWWLVFGYYLIAANVTLNDLHKGLVIFSIPYLMLVFFSYTHPELTNQLRGAEIDIENTRWVHMFTGIQFIVLLFYMEMDALSVSRRIGVVRLTYAFVVFFGLMLTGNRSTILAVIVITIGFILSTNAKKTKSRLSIAAIGVVALMIAYGGLTGIIETIFADLSNTQYNRVGSFDFFVNHFSVSPYGYILGNGFATMTSRFGVYVNDLKEYGIYQSDLGLIGQWSMFGLISVYAVISILWVIIWDKYASAFAKMQAIHIFVSFLMYLIFESHQVVFIMLFLYSYAESRKRALLVNQELPMPSSAVHCK